MIYLLRHGLDDERYIGGYSDIGLIEEGKKQVKKTTKFILDNNLKIDRIVSSDIKRAVETTQIVNDKLNVKLIYEPYLRELNKGDLNGILKDDAKLIYPEYINIQSIYKRYPNGESMEDFYLRIKKVIDKILTLDNSLIITHRGVINMIYYILNEIPVDMEKERFDVTHASIHELNVKEKTIRRIR